MFHSVRLLTAINMCLLCYLVVEVYGHYHERPLRYGPLIPHLKTLFRKFCEIRNDQQLSRAEVDERVDQLIMSEGSQQLLWAYDTFKIEREVRNKRFWKRHAKWVKRLSEDALLLDERIQEVRQNMNISYVQECHQVNDLKALAPDHVRREMQLRMEDCREFARINPQLAKNRCFVEWTIYPIYYGVSPTK